MKTSLGNFGKTPGSTTRNKPTAGQNLPPIGGKPTTKRNKGTITSYGPAIMGLQFKTPQASGPGAAPYGFVTGGRSASEWPLYWALEHLLGPEWKGGWEYQGHSASNAQVRGFARVDFIIFQPEVDKGVRVQAYRFHLNVDAAKQAYDEEQYLATHNKYFRVIDVWEQDYLNDETGQAAIQLMLQVINGVERINPLSGNFTIGLG